MPNGKAPNNIGIRFYNNNRLGKKRKTLPVPQLLKSQSQRSTTTRSSAERLDYGTHCPVTWTQRKTYRCSRYNWENGWRDFRIDYRIRVVSREGEALWGYDTCVDHTRRRLHRLQDSYNREGAGPVSTWCPGPQGRQPRSGGKQSPVAAPQKNSNIFKHFLCQVLTRAPLTTFFFGVFRPPHW